jgi:hypothetical protein
MSRKGFRDIPDVRPAGDHRGQTHNRIADVRRIPGGATTLALASATERDIGTAELRTTERSTVSISGRLVLQPWFVIFAAQVAIWFVFADQRVSVGVGGHRASMRCLCGTTKWA